MDSHTALAGRLGATPEQLEAVLRGDWSPFEPAWGAAFAWADAMTPEASHPSDDVWAALAAHWTPPQIVEITAVIALFALFNRFANALQVPPTR